MTLAMDFCNPIEGLTADEYLYVPLFIPSRLEFEYLLKCLSFFLLQKRKFLSCGVMILVLSEKSINIS